MTCQCVWVKEGRPYVPCPSEATGDDGLCDTCRTDHSDGDGCGPRPAEETRGNGDLTEDK